MPFEFEVVMHGAVAWDSLSGWSIWRVLTCKTGFEVFL